MTSKLMTYEDMLDNLSVIRGQIAETLAKTKLLRERLKTDPDSVNDLNERIRKLEGEALDAFVNLEKIGNQIDE